MAVIDGKKEELNSILSTDPSVYSDYEKIKEINGKLEALSKEEEPLITEWTSLMEEIEC